MSKRSLYLILVAIGFAIAGGCAKGMLWQTGRISPWARNKWAEEERIADTLFTKKRRMEESVSAAKAGSMESRQRVAAELGKTIAQDPVQLIRLQAVKLLGDLDCPEAIEVLEEASQDHNTDLRIAAVEAWRQKSPEVAIAQLHRMVGGDTNIDVRIAATRALGGFKGGQAVRALGMALNDPDPALQLRAADSLRSSTGQPFGRDIAAWQDFVQRQQSDPASAPFPSRIAEKNGLSEIFERR